MARLYVTSGCHAECNEASPGAPGGSSSFTSDPVSAQASIDIAAGALRADPVQVTVPVEISLTSGGREILVPIRLQLKIRIR